MLNMEKQRGERLAHIQEERETLFLFGVLLLLSWPLLLLSVSRAAIAYSGEGRCLLQLVAFARKVC
jgi:hypothetical protein